MDGRPTWTDCDEAGDYVVPNVLSPRDLVSRPDNMDETVPHTYTPILYSKIGVYRGVPYFLIFAPKHGLWVLVRTTSLRRF